MAPVDMELRNWVEENLHTGRLKAVVCTASLDLGVDFRPVETVVQVGSPKELPGFCKEPGEVVTVPATSAVFISCLLIRWNWLRPRPRSRPSENRSLKAGSPCFCVLMY